MASYFIIKTRKPANEPSLISPVVFLMQPSVNELALVNTMTQFTLENAK